MKLIISGISGFVGTNLIDYLQKSAFEIIPLLRKVIGKNGIEISWDKLDQAPEEVNAMVHLAGKAHDLKNASNPEEYTYVNTTLSIQLFDYFLRSKATKFIFVSSVKAAADTVEGILKEEDECNPQTPYGKSKRAAEEEMFARLKQWKLQNPNTHKELFVLRPCMIQGPGNKGNLNLLYTLMKKGIPYPLGAFSNYRSFLGIENLCFVIKEILEKDLKGGVFQVADDEPLSTNDLITLMAEVEGKKATIWHIPVSLIIGFAKVGDLLKLPLNTERLKKLTESYVVSNERIKQLIQTDLPVTTKEGLKRTFLSFQTKV